MTNNQESMWERFDKQIVITFPNGELHPAQYGQLLKFFQSELSRIQGRVEEGIDSCAIDDGYYVNPAKVKEIIKKEMEL